VNDAALRELAQRLGSGAAARLDVERTAQAVVARLRREPRATAARWLWRQPAWLRVAAAVVILVGAGLVVRGGGGSPTSRDAAPVEPGAAELNELSAEQLQEVLQTVGHPAGGQESVLSQDVGLEELNAPELRALLESLEG